MARNKEVARALYLIADILEMGDEQWFKVRAYRTAAQNIEALERPIEDVHAAGGLQDIDGVGKAIAEKVGELLDTGKMEYLEKLRKGAPKELEAMVSIQGLGPKKIGLIYRNLRVQTLAQLEKAASEGRLRTIKGLGEKTERMVLDGIVVHSKTADRMLLGDALPVAEEVLALLRGSGAARKVEMAGSLRRMRSTIGDIDIIAVASDARMIMDVFTTMPAVRDVISKGRTKSSVVLQDDVQVDLRVVKEDELGAALQYFTGSKAHNVHLRSLAQSKGLKLNEYGVFKGKRKVAGRTEEDVYRKLGLDWIPPELREDRGEVEAASEGTLPRLVEQKDLKGDLHMHTDRSDGKGTLLDMLKGAKAIGHRYVAITEHTESLSMAGLGADDMVSWAKEVRKAGKRLGIGVLAGCELEIRKDGSLDYEGQGVLDKLDIVVGAVHSHFKLKREDQMARMENALGQGVLNVLAHPTTRVIGRRDGLDLDMEGLLAIAKRNKVAMEIDSWPDRMDLGSQYVRMAKDMGVKLCINSDAHAVKQLDHIRFGVATARRGWLGKDDVVNTYTLKRLRGWLKG